VIRDFDIKEEEEEEKGEGEKKRDLGA